MQKFSTHTGVAAPILRDNVNTDMVIPSKEMRRVSKTGLAEGLFAPWRYLNAAAREIDPNFVLNQAEYRDTSIIISGSNFGCGSSREHAVWALKEFGIRAIIAEGFGSIFFRNCVHNGILPIKLNRQHIDNIVAWVAAQPQQNQVSINLHDKYVLAKDKRYHFAVEGSDQEMLIEGLDQIAVTLKLQTEIDAFNAKDRESRPWV